MIRSYWIANNTNGVSYPIFETHIRDRTIYTSACVGDMHEDNADVTVFGEQTLDYLYDYIRARHKTFTIRYQGITDISHVKTSLESGFKTSKKNTLYFVICKNTEIYDAVMIFLNIKLQA